MIDYQQSFTQFGKTHSATAMTRHALLPTFASYLLCVTAISAQSQPYSFITLAGSPGATGTNDGAGQESRFHSPVGIAVDPAGTLFIADFLNHTVRKMTFSGTNWLVSTIAGLAGTSGYADGTNSDARFNRPTGIALDKVGNIFVSERYNHTIREIRAVGTNWVVSTVAGQAKVTGHQDGTNTDAQFYLPSGLAVDDSNNLYVADAANFTIREIVPVGTNWIVSTIVGSVTNAGFLDGTNLDALFDYPYDVAVDSAGKLYVADWGNDAIRQIERAGTNWVVRTIAGLSGAFGTNDGPGSVAGFYSPAGIAVDRAGNLYVTDQFNDTIRKIAPGQTDWMVSTIAGQALRPGSADGVETDALFNLPWGITVDNTGKLFIVDHGNNIIREGLSLVLQISLAGSQVVLSWPVSTSNYVLEASLDLGIAVAWIPLTNGTVVVGDTMVLTNSLSTSGTFYRLRE
jgi:sugar lactone lactonase YvrE